MHVSSRWSCIISLQHLVLAGMQRLGGFCLCNLECMHELVFAPLQKSERNLRRALLMLETCRVLQTPMTATQEPQLPDWELYIQVSLLCIPSGLDGSQADTC